MHGSLSAAVLVASLSLFTEFATADTFEAQRQARKLLARNDARAAAVLLEDALPDASSDRAAVFELLRQAYESAAKQAEAEGRPRDAETFRDNLEILSRKAPAQPATTEPTVKPATLTPGTANLSLNPDTSSPAPQSASEPPASLPPSKAARLPLERIPRAEPGEASARVASTVPAPAQPQTKSSTTAVPASPNPSAPGGPESTARADVAAADAAFVAKRYDKAGRIYGALEREGRLPKARRDHWAYCRWVDVVRRINAKPTTPQEWASIDAEIEKIRALSPKNWFSDYLRNLAAERSGGVSRRAIKSNKVVVRGSAPDEPPPGLLAATDPETARSPLLTVAPQPPRTIQAPAPAQAPQPSRAPESEPMHPAPQSGKWLVHETDNFRILHADDELAAKVAGAAEAARVAQTKRWAESAPREHWSPKCDIYLYPTAQIFSRMTGQPEDSPGFSTMGMNGGRITARRINLRADHPNLVNAILPHEITHVVLADLFPHQQIPRWADEGMAVLAEPSTEQHLRAADLREPLGNGKLFRVEDLMVMDYPDGRYWGLYYAQSVSLTRFLVEQGTPGQFIKFVQNAQKNGPEAELRRVYQFDGFADLNRRWVAFARDRMKEAIAKSEAGDTARRE